MRAWVDITDLFTSARYFAPSLAPETTGDRGLPVTPLGGRGWSWLGEESAPGSVIEKVDGRWRRDAALHCRFIGTDIGACGVGGFPELPFMAMPEALTAGKLRITVRLSGQQLDNVSDLVAGSAGNPGAFFLAYARSADAHPGDEYDNGYAEIPLFAETETQVFEIVAQDDEGDERDITFSAISLHGYCASSECQEFVRWYTDVGAYFITIEKVEAFTDVDGVFWQDFQNAVERDGAVLAKTYAESFVPPVLPEPGQEASETCPAPVPPPGGGPPRPPRPPGGQPPPGPSPCPPGFYWRCDSASGGYGAGSNLGGTVCYCYRPPENPN
jgi:hypothetical protein